MPLLSAIRSTEVTDTYCFLELDNPSSWFIMYSLNSLCAASAYETYCVKLFVTVKLVNIVSE